MIGTTAISPQQPSLDGIVALLRRRYGDLDDPRYGFVWSAYDARPYDGLRARLERAGARVEESTDLDDDLAVFLSATLGGERVGLELSLVGPYAVLRCPVGGGRHELVTAMPPPGQPGSDSPLLRLCFEAVRGAGLTPLGPELLGMPVPMRALNGEPGEPTLVYEVLFCRTYPPAW